MSIIPRQAHDPLEVLMLLLYGRRWEFFRPGGKWGAYRCPVNGHQSWTIILDSQADLAIELAKADNSPWWE